MIKAVCPRCGSEKIDYIDSNHQGMDLEEMCGHTDDIYSCPKCRIDFGTWTDFNIEITRHVVEWVEDWVEDWDEEREEECDDFLR